MDDIDNRPTLRGEIKKARASNYNLSRAINEFIDNALDTDATKIQVNFKENSYGLCSISISDNSTNGISEKLIKKIFSWTYERDRKQKDIGEFGTGFKSASVNLGEKLVLITWDKLNDKYLECTADWNLMAEQNTWVPMLKQINKDLFTKHNNHPFESGSTFTIDNLIQTKNNKFDKSYVIDIAGNYKYILKYYPYLEISIKHQDSVFNLKDYTYYYFDQNEKIEENIGVYILKKDFMSNKELDYIIGVLNKKTYIKYKGKFKNGNYKLEEVDFDPIGKFYDKTTTIMFSSCLDVKLKTQMLSEEEIENELDSSVLPCGSVDIVRHNRVVGKSINNFIAPRNDGYANYIKHEISYDDKILDLYLGITFNKSNDGHIPETNLKYLFHYLVKKHQSRLINGEKLKPKPAIPEPVCSSSDDESVKSVESDDSDSESDVEPNKINPIAPLQPAQPAQPTQPTGPSKPNNSNTESDTESDTESNSSNSDSEEESDIKHPLIKIGLTEAMEKKIVSGLEYYLITQYKTLKINQITQKEFFNIILNKMVDKI